MNQKQPLDHYCMSCSGLLMDCTSSHGSMSQDGLDNRGNTLVCFAAAASNSNTPLTCQLQLRLRSLACVPELCHPVCVSGWARQGHL